MQGHILPVRTVCAVFRAVCAINAAPARRPPSRPKIEKACPLLRTGFLPKKGQGGDGCSRGEVAVLTIGFFRRLQKRKGIRTKILSFYRYESIDITKTQAAILHYVQNRKKEAAYWR